MVERSDPSDYQKGFEPTKEHLSTSTHTIYPGALIKVKTRSRSGFALALVIDNEFDVHRYSEEYGDPSERPRHLFEADGPFTVRYAKYRSRIGYDKGTRLYAFLNPPDGTVVKIPGRK